MSRERDKFFIVVWLKLATLVIFCLPYITCFEAGALLHRINPSTVKKLLIPYKPQYNFEHLEEDFLLKQKDTELLKRFRGERVFQIEPSDAIDVTKYSQPAIDRHMNSSPDLKVPSVTFSTVQIPSLPTQYAKNPSFQEEISTYDSVPKGNTSKPMRDLRFIESVPEKSSPTLKSSLGGEYKFEDEKSKDFQSDMSFNDELSNSRSQHKNNFTDAEANMLPVSSDAVLSYQTPSADREKDMIKYTDSFKLSADQEINVSSHYSEKPISTFSNSVTPSSISSVLPELTISTETAIIFNTYHHVEILNQTDPNENTLSTSVIPSVHDEANFSSSIPLLDSENEKLSSGTVAGIVIAVLVCVTLLSSAVIYLLYRKYNGKCTSVVEGKFNTDNCGYLDDSLRSSIYLNNHIELPKESSEEMSSLDNDSFLNSLETMTIQNYWADNSKNTKV